MGINFFEVDLVARIRQAKRIEEQLAQIKKLTIRRSEMMFEWSSADHAQVAKLMISLLDRIPGKYKEP